MPRDLDHQQRALPSERNFRRSISMSVLFSSCGADCCCRDLDYSRQPRSCWSLSSDSVCEDPSDTPVSAGELIGNFLHCIQECRTRVLYGRAQNNRIMSWRRGKFRTGFCNPCLHGQQIAAIDSEVEYPSSGSHPLSFFRIRPFWLNRLLFSRGYRRLSGRAREDSAPRRAGCGAPDRSGLR